jgi:hypothetical protein
MYPFYSQRTPTLIRQTLWALGVAALCVLAIGLYAILVGHAVIPEPSSLGQQGDFFGGHIAALIGSVTLAFVIYTSYVQSRQTELFFMRQYFLSGVEHIAEALQAGDHIRVARLLDYFSRLALSRSDDELYLILELALTPAVEGVIAEEGTKGYAEGYSPKLNIYSRCARSI